MATSLPMHLRAALAVVAASLVAAACSEPPARPLCEPHELCLPASEEACASGPEARLYGRAGYANGTCVARDEATCRASTVTCAHFGQCAFSPTPPRPGPCPGGGNRDFLASRNPSCISSTCVAASDEDCRAARVCTEEGRCTASGGICVAENEADCRASANCPKLGWCQRTTDGQCRPAAITDCQRSERCQRFGDCGLRGAGCSPCRSSDACRVEGLCERVQATCRATEPRHCQASEACKREGRCRLERGACRV